MDMFMTDTAKAADAATALPIIDAWQLARDSGDTEQAVQALCFLGHLLLGQAVWGDAQLRFGEALALAAGSEAGEGTWNALYGLARVAMARGRPQDALQLLEEAMLSIESIRSRLERGRLRAGFFGDRRSVYALAVDALAATPGPPGTVAARAFPSTPSKRDRTGSPSRARGCACVRPAAPGA